MNKRITSILLCFVMVFCMLATAVPAYAASAPTFSIEADKATANPGDTITYTLYLQQPDTITAFGANIVVPAGLSFVANSGQLSSAAVSLFGYTFEFVPEQKQVQWFDLNGNDFTDTSKIALMTFKCMVDANATVNTQYEVTLTNVEMTAGSTQDYDEINSTVVVVPHNVTVEAKPVAVTGVTIAESLSIKTGEKKTPSFNVLPADATNKAVTFSSNNPAVATVNATTGEVTGVKKGTATITIKTKDGNHTDTCVVMVACSHANISDKSAVAATCKAGGNEAYKKCDDCGQLFNTSGAEITAIPTTGKNMSNHTGTAEWTQTATQHTKAYDCCGTVVVATEIHDWNNGVCNECDYVCQHSGGTATCKAAKICQHCGMSYGSKNANNHAGTAKWTQTATQHTKAYDCCDAVVVATEDHHWSNGSCTECGFVCTSHTGGTATCTAKAICETCGKAYGSVDSDNHDWDTTTWSKDASGHWYACKNGCGEKNSFAAHTPDHDGGASDEYAVKCTKCFYVIHAQLNHTHVFDKEVKNSNYKAADATCMKGTTYYKSCKCGEASTTATFTDTDVAPDNHNWATTLTSGDTNHWYACKNAGCTVKKDEATHDYSADWKSDANNHWNACTCGARKNIGAHVDENKDYKCDTCQYSLRVPSAGGVYTPPVNAEVDNSSLNNAAQAVGGAIVSGNAEMKPAAGYTKEDIVKLQKDGKLNLTIDKKSGCNAADKKLIDKAISKAGGVVSGTAVMYFDIDVLLKTNNGATVATVTNTEKALTITIDLSTDLQKAAKDGKHICVVRVHDGKTDFISCNLNAAKTKISFSSADFSSYAVVALDKVPSADTFDSGIALYGVMALMSVTGGATLVISKKRHNK